MQVYAYALIAVVMGGIVIYAMHYIDKAGKEKGIKEAEAVDTKKVANVAARLVSNDPGFSVLSKDTHWGTTVSP